MVDETEREWQRLGDGGTTWEAGAASSESVSEVLAPRVVDLGGAVVTLRQ